jgi:hypothetical protein
MLNISVHTSERDRFMGGPWSKRGAIRMSLRDEEFRVLRETVAMRGTFRMLLVPIALFGWALLTVGLLVFSHWPIASGLSLLVLFAGFEAVHALHVGVERIGRFIQVYYEGDPAGPRWESTAMRLGPGLPGGGVDPLFALIFIGAALANLVVPFLQSLSPADAVVLLGLHAAFIARVVGARLAAARQRARDLEIFRRVRAEEAGGGSSPTV